MCGVFGFIGIAPDMALLKQIAELAATRGMHAWGIAYIEPNGTQGIYKEIGSLAGKTDLLDQWDYRAVIGHCRLSTSGTPNNVVNNQPLIVGSYAVAHNGNVYNYREIADRYGLTLRTQSDSEVIPALLNEVSGTPKQVHERVVGVIDSPYAILTLSKNGIYAMRNRLPLFAAVRDEGVYFCSREFQGAVNIEERTVYGY